MKKSQEEIIIEHKAFLERSKKIQVLKEPSEYSQRMIDKLKELIPLSEDATYEEVIMTFRSLPNNQDTQNIMNELSKILRQKV